VSGRTILADTFAIVSGRSKIQTRAIADAVVSAVEKDGYLVARVEGYADGTWILIDLGNVIVHVFTPEQRTFYNLERLWSLPSVAGNTGSPETSDRRSAIAARPPAAEPPGSPNAAEVRSS
jgi:ribosome-associated protein